MTLPSRISKIAAALLSCALIYTPMSNAATDTNIDNLPKMTLRFGDNTPANSPSGEAAVKLAEIVSQKSHGRLTLKLYPDNQLGSNRDLVEQTSLGGLDMSMAGIGILGYIDAAYNLMQVPFLFSSQESIHKTLRGPIGQRLAKGIEKKRNIVLLSQNWDRLPRQLCSAAPIKTPADLSNVLIRTGSKGATEAFGLFNAKATSIPMSEVYLALQNHVVTAVDLPADYIYNMSLSEVCKNLDMLDHTYGTQFVAINKMRFDRLPAAYQKILSESVHEAEEFNNNLVKKDGDAYVEKLAAQGMHVVRLTPEQHDAFAKVVRDNIAKIEQIWPETKGIGQKILSGEQ